MKYYSIETPIKSMMEDLKRYLTESGTHYKVAWYEDAWHFEIKLDASTVESRCA